MTVTELVLVRHGQSTGNVAREQALAQGSDVIEIDQRDPDVPLTPLGENQARALGSTLRASPSGPPQTVFSSPYVRARQTAELALAAAGLDRRILLDERLRDRELGILDLLTSTGVANRWPEETQRRRWLGKLYYRPPGGESWADVALRLRSFLRDLDEVAAGSQRVLVVSHDAVIMLLRYVCEGWDETTLMQAVAETEVANASVTRLVRTEADHEHWSASAFNVVDHLEAVPAQPDNRDGDGPGVEVEGQRVSDVG
jgi:broad specificity phosphatase PhoE